MTKRELLENYRSLVREIDLLEKQSAFLNQYVGGPRPVRSVVLTGMPRGTNEPEAAILQRADYDDAIYELERKSEELRELLNEFNAILDAIDDVDDRNILRAYYALNWTDESIGKWLNYDKSTIWRRRNQLMNSLSLQPVHISAYGQP
ncbi:MAG: hypothetical protein IIZ93_06275 [Acidaminococcaceae bacterium]|nr:hypothetical protein [Acidaminococcaceae bacterium]